MTSPIVALALSVLGLVLLNVLVTLWRRGLRAPSEVPDARSREGRIEIAAGIVTLALTGFGSFALGPLLPASTVANVAAKALWAGFVYGTAHHVRLVLPQSGVATSIMLFVGAFGLIGGGARSEIAAIMGAVALASTLFMSLRDRKLARAHSREALLRRLSHNLRTPAAGIRSLAEALERGDVEDPAERARFLALIRGEAERLSTGLDRMLRAARGEGLELAPVRLDLADWARAAAERWRARLPGLRLAVEGPCAAMADPERLDEAVDALLDNAMRYGGGGEVALSVERAGPHVGVAVRDAGPGIAPERRDEVRRRLAGNLDALGDEAGGSPSAGGDRRRGGYGLGLWAAGAVARAHGGALAIEDGSRLVLWLPPAAAGGAAQAAEAAAVPAPPPGEARP